MLPRGGCPSPGPAPQPSDEEAEAEGVTCRPPPRPPRAPSAERGWQGKCHLGSQTGQKMAVGPQAPQGQGSPTRRDELQGSFQSSFCPRLWWLKLHHTVRVPPSLHFVTPSRGSRGGPKGQSRPTGDRPVPTWPQPPTRPGSPLGPLRPKAMAGPLACPSTLSSQAQPWGEAPG